MTQDNRKTQRGAALILTVVVIMVLTTLALTMATFTVNEERTAVTYRDSLQTRMLAEAGVRVVQEVFRTPSNRKLVPLYSAAATADGSGWDYWGADEDEIETQLNEIGVWRANRTGATPQKYAGSNNRFFQGSFKDTWEQVFGGTYSQTAANDRYDLKFNCTDPSTGTKIANASTACWLDTNINALLLDGAGDYQLDNGAITDISFYGPPSAGGDSYGLATVRVTATKYDSDGTIASRETIEAVIIDTTPRPAVLGNGDIVFKTKAGVMCGDGCENIHANGNATIGTISGGADPMITATGWIAGGSGNTKPGASAITAPEINPWDLEYKPKIASQLDKYYLAAARPLDGIWTDSDPTTGVEPRLCGLNLLAVCQDYNLEFMPSPANTPRLRTAASVPALYKWDSAKQGWTLCASGTNLAGGVACPGAPTFSVSRAADLAVSGGADTSHLPFNANIVPQTTFQITSAQVGATVLVDGAFSKHGNMNTTMTIIAAGSLDFQSQTEWGPALQNKVMWIAGRDIHMHANCCAPSNTCATNLGQPTFAGVIAAHEQVESGSQNALLGVLIAENRVQLDTTVGGSLAINSDNGDHGSLCGNPSWPWALPVTPGIASMKSAAH